MATKQKSQNKTDAQNERPAAPAAPASEVPTPDEGVPSSGPVDVTDGVTDNVTDDAAGVPAPAEPAAGVSVPGALMGTPANGIVSGEPQGDTGAPNQG